MVLPSEYEIDISRPFNITNSWYNTMERMLTSELTRDYIRDHLEVYASRLNSMFIQIFNSELRRPQQRNYAYEDIFGHMDNMVRIYSILNHFDFWNPFLTKDTNSDHVVPEMHAKWEKDARISADVCVVPDIDSIKVRVDTSRLRRLSPELQHDNQMNLGNPNMTSILFDGSLLSSTVVNHYSPYEGAWENGNTSSEDRVVPDNTSINGWVYPSSSSRVYREVPRNEQMERNSRNMASMFLGTFLRNFSVINWDSHNAVERVNVSRVSRTIPYNFSINSRINTRHSPRPPAEGRRIRRMSTVNRNRT